MESVPEEDETVVINVEDPRSSTLEDHEKDGDDPDVDRLLDSEDKEDPEEVLQECGEGDQEDDEDPSPPQVTATRAKKGLPRTRMARLIRNLNIVNKKLTRSAAWREDFNRRRAAMNKRRKEDKEGPPLLALLAEYGIRLNIELDRWERMYAARDIIDEMMKEDLAKVHSKKRRPRKNGAKLGYFHKLIFSVGDWESLQEVIQELKPLRSLCRRMEGDGPTGCMVLHEYSELRSSLNDRLTLLLDDDQLYPMINEMLQQTTIYLNEAIECDSLVLATIFHPSFRLGFFDFTFEDDSGLKERAENLLRAQYHDRQAEFARKTTPTDSTNADDIIEVSATSVKKKLPKVFDLYKQANTSSDLGELDRYLQGLDPLSCDNPEDLLNPQCALDWWKEHGVKYPVLSSLAQDYLSITASSAPGERLFTVAGQVCSANQASMRPRCIKTSVGSRMWTRQGVPLPRSFSKVDKVIDYINKTKGGKGVSTLDVDGL